MDPVTLIAPNGAEYTTTDPVEASNLQFGHGYKPKPQPATDEPTAVESPVTADPAGDSGTTKARTATRSNQADAK